MSLVSFSDNFGQISLYPNYQLQWQCIGKLNNTMQTKQHATKKPHSYNTNRNKGLFLWWKEL